MKKILLTLAALSGFFITQNAEATCSNYTSYVDGQTLTSSSLNSLQSNYTNCVNGVLDGDTFTGTLNLHSGADINFFSDTGTTLKASIDGATGEIIGAPVKAGTYNIDLARATTSVAGDSIKIQCGGAACSVSNPGFVVMNSATTAGALSQFTVTSDVTINLTGAHWAAGTTGDLTGRILRVLAANDNGTLRWCVALVGGRDILLTTDTNATATNINLAQELLCNSAISSSSNTALEVGYFRSDFDDTGGSSEDLNTIQSGINDVVTGKSADGLWQPWNQTFTGFSSNPNPQTSHWSQNGATITVESNYASGTSNLSTYHTTLPVPSRTTITRTAGPAMDNSVPLSTECYLAIIGTDVTFGKTFASLPWTAAGSKKCDFNVSYEAGPSASFIE